MKKAGQLQSLGALLESVWEQVASAAKMLGGICAKKFLRVFGKAADIERDAVNKKSKPFAATAAEIIRFVQQSKDQFSEKLELVKISHNWKHSDELWSLREARRRLWKWRLGQKLGETRYSIRYDSSLWTFSRTSN